MTSAVKFRLLLVGQWMIPPLALVAALWAVPSANEGLSPSDVDLGERTYWMFSPSWAASAELALFAAFIVATVGLFRFRGWAPRVYAAVLAINVGLITASRSAELSGSGQVLLLVDGLLAGATLTWLLVARHQLPFPPARRAS